MREISLDILDAAQNSIDAGATVIEISVTVNDNGIAFDMTDNGVGMTENELLSATGKGVSFKQSSGLGLYLLKRDAEESGGALEIESQSGKGTAVSAKFVKNCVLGDLGATFVTLVGEEYDVILTLDISGNVSRYDTGELKSSAGVADLQSLGALRLIREDINNKLKLNGGAML